jgi:hypothetical protein
MPPLRLRPLYAETRAVMKRCAHIRCRPRFIDIEADYIADIASSLRHTERHFARAFFVMSQAAIY